MTCADVEADPNKADDTESKADDTENNVDGQADVAGDLDDDKPMTKVPDSESVNEETNDSDKIGAIETQTGGESDDKMNLDTEKSRAETEDNVHGEEQTIKDSIVSNDDVPIISGMAPVETHVDEYAKNKPKTENKLSNQNVNQSNIHDAPNNVGENTSESETNRIVEEVTRQKNTEANSHNEFQSMGNESSWNGNSEGTIAVENKDVTPQRSENAEHLLDEREESSQVDNSGTLKPEEYSLGPDESTLGQHINTGQSEERTTDSDIITANETDNTLEGTLLTTSIMNTQEKEEDSWEIKDMEDATKPTVQGEEKNTEDTVEESQAEISEEGVEENIVNEAQKENTSKFPMIADAEKDNWEAHQGQTNRSHDESAEVEAEVVEETSIQSAQELVLVQEEVLEEKKSIEVTTDTNEIADNTVEKVNGQESSPENLNLTKSAEEVTTEEVHTESSPQIAQSRLSEDGTEEKNNEDSITMEHQN